MVTIAAIAFTRVSPEAHGRAVDEIAPASNDVNTAIRSD
jgi:hypothetical protein